MTMPHLMNCSHSEDGWCLECVKELWESQYSDYQNVANECIEKEAEIVMLKAALKSARQVVLEQFRVGMRQFARMCAISPTQLSKWTSDAITELPDIICRSEDIGL